MKKYYILFLLLLLTSNNSYAQDGSQFLGQIKYVSFKEIPKGWAHCNGELLSIAKNQALFALLGTTYGGDGMTTFALPNLQGRVLIGDGAGYTLGQTGGSETHTLSGTELPAHTHQVIASSEEGDSNDPTNNFFANTKVLDKEYKVGVGDTNMAKGLTSSIGLNNQPHNNNQPTLVLQCIIALVGVFPSSN